MEFVLETDGLTKRYRDFTALFTLTAMYDGIILLAATGCGMIFFRKKDLR